MSSSKIVKSGRKPSRAGMGRPKGCLNKTTRTLREAAVLAAELAGQDLTGAKEGEGVVEYLRIQAKENPKAFLPFLGRVLPLQLTGENGGAIESVTRIEIVGHKPKQGDDDDRTH